MRLLLINPKPSNDDLARLCAARGWNAVQVPLHAYAAPSDDGAALRDALSRRADFSWCVVCSPRAADAVCAARHECEERDASSKTSTATKKLSLGWPMSLRCAAVGAATAAALRADGVRVDLVGASDVQAVCEELLRTCGAQLHNLRIALFQAEDGREEWRTIFSASAQLITVEKIACYRLIAIPAVEVTPPLHAAMQQPLDWIVCTAPSAVQRLFELAPNLRAMLPPTTRFAAIGPTTAAALRAWQIQEVLQPESPNFAELIAKIAFTESI